MGRRSVPSGIPTGATISLLLASSLAFAQGGPPSGVGESPPSPRQAAQVDLTGYWVALVTEDWLWRMITPPKGDATSVPLNPRGRSVAGEWDPEADVANAEQCRAFGAAGLMRMPLRLRIGWDDEDTLRIDTDAGEQTRLLRFTADAAAASAPTWQGSSTAQWTRPVAGGFDLRAAFGGAAQLAQGPPNGSLRVVTRNLRAGYLRKNGLPYSANAELTEYFSRASAFGHDYLTVLSIVHDPAYLNGDFVTSSHFKREPDDMQWSPSPCRTAPPLVDGG